MKKRIFTFILASLMLTSCSNISTQKAENTEPSSTLPVVSDSQGNKSDDKKSQTPADKLTVEEKVGQLFLVRCDSNNMEPILSKEPGGILMFGVDFEGLTSTQVKEKIQGYKDELDIDPFIAVDEEGGTVVRVSSNKNLSSVKYQSPQYYYNQGGLQAIIENAATKSDLLLSLGITMNLAPVSDVSTNPDDFIYDRSFGQDAASTAEYVSDVVKVMKKEGIKSCLKHFPGYGNNIDTHTNSLVNDNRSLESFRENDFLPFKSGIDAGTDAVLVAHNIVTSIDETEPASLSPKAHQLLRNELGFDGIIMTDDMSMAAALDYETPYVKAVLAGNDMMIVTDFDTAYNEVLDAVKNGTIPEETVNTAVNRILTSKGE